MSRKASLYAGIEQEGRRVVVRRAAVMCLVMCLVMSWAISLGDVSGLRRICN
jgi:hypothetical protein